MPEATARERFAGYLLLAAGMSLVGVYVALSKPLTAAFPVFLLAWLRFAIAAVAMLPWLRRGAGEPPLSPPLLRTLFLQSLFGNFLFSIFMLHGVALSSATASGVILATLPAMVALFSWLFLRERPSPRVLLAVAVAVAGIAMLGLGGAPDFS
ncbi:MAG: DMT family transporter, partial [Burkholderiaceae bacterium]